MWRRHVCYVCKRSVCGGDEPQPVAHLSHKLQCARQSLKIMVSYGNKYPRHNARPPVVEQSGQCARVLKESLKRRIVPANANLLGIMRERERVRDRVHGCSVEKFPSSSSLGEWHLTPIYLRLNSQWKFLKNLNLKRSKMKYFPWYGR